ncbi:MAG TPA: hypothetical protein DCP11_06570 [Microbacteriaceae bacterium]|jgi:hypothetical protein|nr:hypothetical protein [Microbacteriaceae bacterium]
MRKVLTTLVVLAGVLAIAVGATAVLAPNLFSRVWATAAPPVCAKVAAVPVGEITVPSGPVAGYCQDRLVNAAHIMDAARSLGIGKHTQAIGVMTAMGESGLRVLDHGDAAGADSRGLFQQRDNGAWGTLADRMDPYTSAIHFFKKLVSIPGWKNMTPGEAAHAVQVNQDPNHYDPYWARAQAIVAALSP